MKATTFLIAGIGLCACVASANAAPIAPRAQVTKDGKLLNYDWKGACPDEKAVGVPAYPDSVCIKAAPFNKSSAFVDLMSGADAVSVAAWYAKHLHGWRRTKSATGDIVFTPPGESSNDATAEFSDVHVSIQALSPTQARLKKMIYEFDGTPATVVDIWYSLKGNGQ